MAKRPKIRLITRGQGTRALQKATRSYNPVSTPRSLRALRRGLRGKF